MCTICKEWRGFPQPHMHGVSYPIACLAMLARGGLDVVRFGAYTPTILFSPKAHKSKEKYLYTLKGVHFL